MNLLNIKEVVRQTGLTSRTLRFYEEKGLIAAERDNTTCRCYTYSDIAKIKRIRELKELLGFSLEEIKLFVEVEEKCPHYCEKFKSLDDPLEKTSMIKEGIQILGKLKEIANNRKEGIDKLVEELDEKLFFLHNELLGLQKNTVR